MTEKKFAKGIIVKEVGKYGNIKIAIDSSKFFSDDNNFNEKGWGNFIIRKSKEGKYYCILDEWKPQQKKETKEVVSFNEINKDDLPF